MKEDCKTTVSQVILGNENSPVSYPQNSFISLSPISIFY